MKDGDISLYGTVKKNKTICHLCQKHVIKLSKSKQKVVSLSSEGITCQPICSVAVKRGDLDHFFLHESRIFPVSVSDWVKLRKCTSKPDFLHCIESMVKVKYDALGVLLKVIDGATFINIAQDHQELTEITTKRSSFEKSSLHLGILKCWTLSLISIKKNGLKSQTQENRDKGIRISVRKNTQICKNIPKVY